MTYHNTESVLVKFKIKFTSVQGCISILVFVDLSAALVTTDCDKLLVRLQNYTGI